MFDSPSRSNATICFSSDGHNTLPLHPPNLLMKLQIELISCTVLMPQSVNAMHSRAFISESLKTHFARKYL